MIPLQAIKLLLPKTPKGDVWCWSTGGRNHMKFMNETFMVDVILPALTPEGWEGSLHMYSLNRKGFQTLCAAKSGFSLSTRVLGKAARVSETSSPLIVGNYGNYGNANNTPYSDEIPAEEADLVLYNSGSSFQKNLDFTLSAIAGSGHNENIMNALIHVNGNKVHLISTDGHRLHKGEVAAGNYCLRLEGEDHLRTVPGKIMTIFSMIPGSRLALSRSSASGFDAGSITFEGEIHGEDKKCEIRFRNLSPVNFPRYQHVIPYANKATFSAKTKPLIKAAKLAAKLSSDRAMYFLCDGDNLKFKVKVSRDGDDREYVEIPVEGAAIENKFEYAIAVNPSYFIDALSSFEEVSVEFKDSLSPITIKDANDKSQNDKVDNIAIVMPIRL